MASITPQRSYRAACPGCGAPVEFRSAQSTHAVCSYCRSTVVRDGETLRRLGRMAELFDDHSPLRLQARGRWKGQGFVLVGRLQYASGSGSWTEWHALLDDGNSAVLAEDNGSYVFVQRATALREVPAAGHFRVGATTAFDGRSYAVAASESARLVSAQGELPKLPPLDHPFAMVELRNADGEILSIDYGTQPPVLMKGREVRLDDLQLSGLHEESAREAKARQFACPNCGSQVEVQLENSKSITCRACNSLIDLASGVGGELRHAEQDEPVRPLIALGTVGRLQGADWQVVGYQHRIGHEPGDSDEHFGWDEYLLYNARRGFMFLVDSNEGWSIVRTVSGAASYSPGGQTASYLGTTYRLLYSYNAETTYVAGEFYWPVERGHKTFNRDFANKRAVLSLEETPRERTWSVGHKTDAEVVAKAFGLEDRKELLRRSDAGPTTSSGGGIGCGTLLFLFILLLLVMAMVRACDEQNQGGSGSGFRWGSGSYGGYSSGGSHK